MVCKQLLLAIYLGFCVLGNALATVSEEEAARLGTEGDLTPLGAEWNGNADGSIPAWNPNGAPIPSDFVPGSDNYINPYSNEKPLFSVDTKNYKEHEEFLTEGTKAMIEKLDGFRIDVYPTHRDYVVPEWLYTNTRTNATEATLVEEGQKIVGHYPGIPFPVPQSGYEVLWNHMQRYMTPSTSDYDNYYVAASGKPVLSTTGLLTLTMPIYEDPNALVADKAWVKMRIDYKAPARRAGEILLVHEPGADFTGGKGRKAWQYLTGQRRVRLAPAVNFDTPNPGVAGTSTYDDTFIYNGSPERFDWKLVGKAEMYIPYNCYDFVFQTKIEDAIGPKFFNPDYIRWEKHRVWIVEGHLKEGSRHIYGKRRYYIDEDMWTALASEAYDGRGKLWRVQFAYGANLYDIKSNFHMAYGGYDLLQGIYNINTKPIPGRFANGVDKGKGWFTAKGMARRGIR